MLHVTEQLAPSASDVTLQLPVPEPLVPLPGAGGLEHACPAHVGTRGVCQTTVAHYTGVGRKGKTWRETCALGLCGAAEIAMHGAGADMTSDVDVVAWDVHVVAA